MILQVQSHEDILWDASICRDASVEHVGVVARELRDIAPGMVSPVLIDNEEYLAVNNSEMTYMLINAVKELTDRVRALENELDEFKVRK